MRSVGAPRLLASRPASGIRCPHGCVDQSRRHMVKASEARLLDFLKKSPQFRIPIYQRTYSWTEKECRQLWDDVVRSGERDDISAHFVGSIVYIERGLYQVSS